MNQQLRKTGLTLGLALLLASAANAQLFPGSTGNPLTGSERPRPLPMDQAFPYFVSIVDSKTLNVTWQVAPQHYLYRHQFGFILKRPGGVDQQPLEFTLPAGIAKNDQFFGDVEVYFDGITATVTTENANLPAGTELIIQYQGCAEWGFCYPPQSSIYPLTP